MNIQIVKESYLPFYKIKVTDDDTKREITFYGHDSFPYFSPVPSNLILNMYKEGCSAFLKRISKLIFVLFFDEIRKKYKMADKNILNLIYQFV